MRKITTVLFLLLLVAEVLGQEVAVGEKQPREQEINEIKLSEQAHYAEVVLEVLTDDNEAVSLAQQQSISLLQTHIIEIFAKRLKMTKEDVREIWDVVDDKCQNVEIRRGDLLRVFSYMAKDAFKGWLGKKDIKPLSPEDSLILFGPSSEEKKMMKNVAVTSLSDTNLKDSLKIEEKASAVVENVILEDKKEEKVLAATPVEKKVEPIKEIIIPVLCQKMMGLKDFNELMKYLNKEKDNQKLIFGNTAVMQYQERCYMVVIERTSQKIAAILDKGRKDRMNFMTLKMDKIENYKNGKYAVILVQEY